MRSLVPESTPDSSNQMLAGCEGGFVPKAAGCEPSLCLPSLCWMRLLWNLWICVDRTALSRP